MVFKLIEMFLESLPQIVLQSYLIHKEFLKQNDFTILEKSIEVIVQIVFVFYSFIRIGINCMSFMKEIAKLAEIKLGWCYILTRTISNIVLLVSKLISFILLIYYFKWIIILVCIIRLIIYAGICFKNMKIENMSRRITASIIFTFHRSISFFEEFHFECSYFVFYLLMYLESLILYLIFLFISWKSMVDFSLPFVIVGLVIQLTFIPLGLIIELIYWKLFSKCKSSLSRQKFNIEIITEKIDEMISNFYT